MGDLPPYTILRETKQRHSEEQSDEESKCRTISILPLLDWNDVKGTFWILRKLRMTCFVGKCPDGACTPSFSLELLNRSNTS